VGEVWLGRRGLTRRCPHRPKVGFVVAGAGHNAGVALHGPLLCEIGTRAGIRQRLVLGPHGEREGCESCVLTELALTFEYKYSTVHSSTTQRCVEAKEGPRTERVQLSPHHGAGSHFSSNT